jgi:dynein heavy chain
MQAQAVTRNELYGYLHPATREWKEGLISVTYRDMANNRTNKHQWILLDGDIDAEWIEVPTLHPPALSVPGCPEHA